MWSLSSDKRTDCITLLAEQIFVICKCLVYMRVCSVAVSSSFSAFVVTFLRLFSCCCSPWMDNETSDPLGIDMWKAPLALFFFFFIEAHPDWKRHSLSFRYFIVLFSHFVSLCGRQIEFHKEMLTFAQQNHSVIPPCCHQPSISDEHETLCVTHTHAITKQGPATTMIPWCCFVCPLKPLDFAYISHADIMSWFKPVHFCKKCF